MWLIRWIDFLIRMILDLITNLLPSNDDFWHIFDECHLGIFVLIKNNDWQSIYNPTDNIININTTCDKIWQYHISFYLNHTLDNKWLYFNIAKMLGDVVPCDVTCCYYDNKIIKSPIHDNPFYDFAYIDGHWYLIDDNNADYANDKANDGNIIIVKSIDRQMNDFLNDDRPYPLTYQP